MRYSNALQSADTKGEFNMKKTNVTTQEVATKATEKAVKTATPKTDYKAVAEKIEKAFKDIKSVDVIADTNLDEPKSFAQKEYRYIHFFNPGTKKDMFGCYQIGKNRIRFALSLSVENQLDGLDVQPVEKKIKGEKKKVAVDVICNSEDAVVVAKKIISAYQSKPAAEKKVVEKKPAEKKPAAKATKTTTKKVVNK